MAKSALPSGCNDKDSLPEYRNHYHTSHCPISSLACIEYSSLYVPYAKFITPYGPYHRTNLDSPAKSVLRLPLHANNTYAVAHFVNDNVKNRRKDSNLICKCLVISNLHISFSHQEK